MKYITKKTLLIIVLFILSFLSLTDLLHPGIPVTHDGPDHVARIANFYQSLSEGNIVPRWAGNLNWGYGHPVLMFLYPLPSYISSFFHYIGFSFVNSVKIVFALSFTFSIITMFMWVSAEWGIAAGFIAAILYGFAPYRFVDLYVRGAFGENIAFVFLPLILYGIYGLSNKRHVFTWGSVTSLSIASLIMSHNALSLMFLFIAAVYSLYILIFRLEKIDRRRFIYNLLLFFGIGFAVSAFFWIPAFFEGKYTLRDIVTRGEIAGRMVNPFWFIYSPWNYGNGNDFTKEIGFAQLGFILFSFLNISYLIAVRKKVNNIHRFLIINLVLLFISLLLMTGISFPIWQNISLLQKFQFPWRLLSLSVFSSAVIGALVIVLMKRSYRIPIIIIATVVSVISTIHMWHAKSYSVKDDSVYSSVYASTTDTGESSPIWSVRFMESTPPTQLGAISGAAEVQPGRRTSTRREYKVIAHTRVRLVEYTLYFPGWNVLDESDTLPIEFQDPQYRGLMTFWLEPGEHHVSVVFTNTKMRRVANTISLLGWISLIVAYLVLDKRKI